MKQNIVFITNIPAPYREKLHERLYAHYGDKYSVMYCSTIEKGRLWKVNVGNYSHQFLSTENHGLLYNIQLVINRLRQLKPRVVILPMELKPTFISAMIYAYLSRVKVVFYTDATIDSEAHYSLMRIALRRMQCWIGDAFICISKGGEALYRRYGVQVTKIFKSCLCADNNIFKPMTVKKIYDLVYVCYIREGKLPAFFAEVATFTLPHLLNNDNFKLLIVGEGEERKTLLAKLDNAGIAYRYVGYATQEELPLYYNQSRLMVFTTRRDAWGVTANEAMMCGCPVLVSRAAGCANDLVRDGINGYVLENDNAGEWAERIASLLDNPNLYRQFSDKAVETAKEYNYDAAARGVIEAINSLST